MKKTVIILLAVLAAAVSCRKGDVFEQNSYSLETTTRMAGEIVNGTSGYFGHIKSDKVTNIGQGVSLLDMSYLNMNGYAVQLYLYKVVLGSATLGVAIPAPDKKADYPSALAANLNAEVSVLGAVNGDVQGSDKLSSGIVYRNGTAVKSTFSDAKGGFFATLRDGTAILADQSKYGTYRSSLYNAIGTREMILKDGYVAEEASPAQKARSFVAVSQDGMTVWLGVVDGVYFYYSNGITCSDLAAILKAAGAWNAALLNSGDVTTLIKRDDLGEKLFPVVNTPSAQGIEKESVNALAIIEN
ncbi:MAG: phosphodiester glycosidase family protein [Bacteroidales bacterium]|nr:phosphodiester glycosidase family protein [Bacteroidales bacterium]